MNTFQISGLGTIGGIAASSSDVYVTSYTNGTIGKYDTATGTAVNASLVSGIEAAGGRCRVWLGPVCHGLQHRNDWPI